MVRFGQVWYGKDIYFENISKLFEKFFIFLVWIGLVWIGLVWIGFYHTVRYVHDQ